VQEESANKVIKNYDNAKYEINIEIYPRPIRLAKRYLRFYRLHGKKKKISHRH